VEESRNISNEATLASDVIIQHEVLAELKWDARVSPAEIGVSVRDGVVTLTGRVGSFLKSWAAERAAHRVRGVKAVANDIEVRLPRASERTDAEIAGTVVNALQSDAGLPADKIKVTVEKGLVTLRGEVEWQFQKLDAGRVVRRLTGVRGVTNLIKVNPSVTPTEVKSSIEQALIRSVKTDAERIAVEVEASKVVLKGTVRSVAEKNEAERAAWMAPGVTHVENKISVSYF
jgi:osmotically-inducible protein OsmY